MKSVVSDSFPRIPSSTVI